MYTTSIFSGLSGEPQRSPRRATETPHRLLAAPFAVTRHGGAHRVVLGLGPGSRVEEGRRCSAGASRRHVFLNSTGTFCKGARCKMREGRQRTLTEGLSAFAPLRGRREVVERRACSGRRIERESQGRKKSRSMQIKTRTTAPNCLERSLASWAIKTGKRGLAKKKTRLPINRNIQLPPFPAAAAAAAPAQP